LNAELALFSFPPAGRPTGHPAIQNSSDLVRPPNLSMSIVGPKLEDNLNFWEMEDDLNKTTSIFGQNGRRPQFLGKMEDNLNV
jgi:hypothetical protein